MQGIFSKVRRFFRKRAKKGQKGVKYLKIWAKMYKIWRYFEKASLECDYCMHEKGRIFPDMKIEKGKDDWISNTEEYWDMYK